MVKTAYAKIDQGFREEDEQVDMEALPVATAVASIDPLEYDNNTDAVAVAVPEASHPTRFRVYAPCHLPPNYRLTVKNGPDTDLFEVLVPERGVYAGEAFEAEAITDTEPIRGRWSDGIFDCFYCNEESGCCLFWGACCCSGIVFGALMERLHLDWFASRVTSGDAHRSTYEMVALIWLLMVFFPIANIFTMGLLALVVWMFPFYFCFIRTRTRMVAREKYMISGSCCEDCCLTTFCSCCAALQMHRHMKRSGDTPRPFRSIGHAEIV